MASRMGVWCPGRTAATTRRRQRRFFGSAGTGAFVTGSCRLWWCRGHAAPALRRHEFVGVSRVATCHVYNQRLLAVGKYTHGNDGDASSSSSSLSPSSWRSWTTFLSMSTTSTMETARFRAERDDKKDPTQRRRRRRRGTKGRPRMPRPQRRQGPPPSPRDNDDDNDDDDVSRYIRWAQQDEEDLLQRWPQGQGKNATRNNTTTTIPSRVSRSEVHSVLKSWCTVADQTSHRGTKDMAAQRAEALWNRMQNETHKLQPTATSLNVLLKAWRHNATQIERLLTRVEDDYLQRANDNNKAWVEAPPDRVSYTTLLKSWQAERAALSKPYPKHAKRPFAPHKAFVEEEEEEDDHSEEDKTNDKQERKNDDKDDKNDDTPKPHPEDERIWQVLNRMDAQYAAGNKAAKPDVVTMNVALHCLSSPHRMKELCTRLVDTYGLQPDTCCYNTMMGKWAAQGTWNGAQEAHKLYQEMQHANVQPDVYSLNSVLNAYASCPHMALHAERLLRDAQQRYETKLSNVCPDVYSYNTVIKGWAIAAAVLPPHEPQEEEQSTVAALQEEEEETVATARLGTDKAAAEPESEPSEAAAAAAAARHAAQLLRDMPVCPTVTTYNTVLWAWARAARHCREAPLQAQTLLESILSHPAGHDKDACPVVRPDARSFITVMDAWSKSQDAHKAQKARGILELYHASCPTTTEPNVYAYSVVLNACAYTYGSATYREEALQIAVQTFSEWRQRVASSSPSQRLPQQQHALYAAVLRSIRKLVQDEDSRKAILFRRIFKECCQAGQVNPAVWKQVQAFDAPQLQQEVARHVWQRKGQRNTLPSTTSVIPWNEIPQAWKCNVHTRDFQPRPENKKKPAK